MIRVRGAEGTLLAGGRVVAALANWEILPVGDAWQLTGVVRVENAFWLQAANAFDVSLTVGKRQWLWRRVEARIVGDGFVVNGLGQPEIRGGSNGQ